MMNTEYESLLPGVRLLDDPQHDHDDNEPTVQPRRVSQRRGIVPASMGTYLAEQAALAEPIRELPADAGQDERDRDQLNRYRHVLSAERRRALDAEHAAFLADLDNIGKAETVPPPVPLLHGLYPIEDDRLPLEQYTALTARAAGMGITPAAFADIVEEVAELASQSDADVVEDDYLAGALHGDYTERPAAFVREQAVEALLWLAGLPAREAAEQAQRAADAADVDGDT